MADELSDLRLFTRILAAGNLSEAARRLNSSPPAMSRRLAAMEVRLGVRLVDRGSRRFMPTEEGAILYERGLRILAELDDAEAEVSIGGKTPRGHLRIGSPTHVGRGRVAALVGAFVQLYPHVAVELVLSDTIPNLAEDDLDIIFSPGVPIEPNAIVRKLLPVQRLVICATPDYLARHGLPLVPDDLLAHNCIRLVRGRRLLDHWPMIEGGRPRDVHVHGTLSTSSSEVAHGWALAGLGMAFKLPWDISDDLESGRLVSCLASYVNDERSLNIIYGSRSHLPPRMRAFIDFSVATFKSEKTPLNSAAAPAAR